MIQKEAQQPWDRSRECKDMTHYKYFRCLISTLHSAYQLLGRGRIQIRASVDLPDAMANSLWTPSLSRKTCIYFHTHPDLTRCKHKRFCNSMKKGHPVQRQTARQCERDYQTDMRKAEKQDITWWGIWEPMILSSNSSLELFLYAEILFVNCGSYLPVSASECSTTWCCDVHTHSRWSSNRTKTSFILGLLLTYSTLATWREEERKD